MRPRIRPRPGVDVDFMRFIIDRLLTVETVPEYRSAPEYYCPARVNDCAARWCCYELLCCSSCWGSPMRPERRRAC